MLPDQLLLFRNDPLQQIHVLLHRRLSSKDTGIIFSAHADRYDILISSAAFQPVFPVVYKPLFIDIKIPVTPVTAVRTVYLPPFLTGTQTWFMMGIPHHNSVQIRQLLIGASRAVQRK